jgi:DNA-binding transcriptional LysR family regulator
MRKDLHDLVAFLAVAREGSFTRAAARLDTTQSALSHTIRKLEARLGVRLLARTTRSVSTTEAGERLLNSIGPLFDDIEAELTGLSSFRERPAGTIRISTSVHAAESVVLPVLETFLPAYPDIQVEVSANNELVDIVADRYDFGIRLGEQVDNGMIAVRVGPDFRMRVVATPAYFETHAKPSVPHDLTSHNCINIRLPTYGSLFPWEFAKDGRDVKVRVEGQLTLNSTNHILRAALDGLGLAWVPDDMARQHIDAGELVAVLDDWCEPFPGYHLYYPSRRHMSSALTHFVDALRYRP